jgi:hypothetical protein
MKPVCDPAVPVSTTSGNVVVPTSGLLDVVAFSNASWPDGGYSAVPATMTLPDVSRTTARMASFAPAEVTLRVQFKG